MSEAPSPQMLLDAVSARMRAELAKQSEKAAMRETRLPRSLINRARSGFAPGQSAKLLLTLKRLGTEAALRILEPVLGPMDDASLARRLDAILREVGDIRHAVTAPVAQDQNRLLGAAGGDRQGEAGAAGGESRSDQARLALVQTRRALDATRESAALRRVLNVFRPGQIALDAALEYAAHDPWTGVAWKDPGNDWLVRPAANNRLCGGETDARPLSRFPDHDYAERVRIGFAEAVASADPVAFEHVGGLIRNGALTSIHANVVRIGGADKGGREIVIATHERLAA